MNLYRITYSVKGKVSDTMECLLASDLSQAKETFELRYPEFEFVSVELNPRKVHEVHSMPGWYSIDEGENENTTSKSEEQYRKNLISLSNAILEREIKDLKRIGSTDSWWSKLHGFLFGQSNDTTIAVHRNPDVVIYLGSKLNGFD